MLRQQVERNQRNFQAIILWRDTREVDLSLIIVPAWLWLGWHYTLPWTWYLCVPALLWIAGFMVVDRMRSRRRQPRPDAPLHASVAGSLAEVEHQIGLLRNVLWWYLLPPDAVVVAFLVQCGWIARESDWRVRLGVAGMIAFAVLVNWGIYLLNQYAVRQELEPRRKELQALLASLDADYQIAS